MTKHIHIHMSLLPKPQAKYIHEKTEGPSGQKYEKLCVMGQILQQLGEKTYLKTGPVRFLHELKTAIPPFTRCVRGVNLQSDVANAIMVADPHTDGGRAQISKILAQYNYTITFGD